MQANGNSFGLSEGGVLGRQPQVCNSSWIVLDSMVAPIQGKSRLIIPSFTQAFLERKNLLVHGLIYTISFAVWHLPYTSLAINSIKITPVILICSVLAATIFLLIVRSNDF